MGKEYHNPETLKELYHGEGLSLSEIADRFDTTAPTISRWMDKHGIEKRSQGPAVADERVKDAEWLERQYSVKQKSVNDISDETGCSNKTVLKWLDKHNIGTRPQQRLAGDERVYDCDYLRREYVANKRHAWEIADELDCGKTTVLRQLEECGIDRRSKSVASSMAREGVNRAAFYTNKRGYELAVVRDGDRARAVRIHQLVAIADGADPETVFSDGKYHVHHASQVPWDNRPENLEVVSAEEHGKIHWG